MTHATLDSENIDALAADAADVVGSVVELPVDDLSYTLTSWTRRTSTIVELTLRPAGPPLHFRPGQYVLLGDDRYMVPVRSYSVANAPQADGRLRLLVTEVPGGEASTWVHHVLRVGDDVLVSGPYGTFGSGCLSAPGTPVLALAAGSGLAPIRSLAEEAVRRRRPGPLTLMFSARSTQDVWGQAEFEAWHQQHPDFTFSRTLTREVGSPPIGRIPGLLPQLVGDLSGYHVLVAGAPGFVADCAQAARRLGVRPGHLHTEEFFAEPQPWTSTADATAPGESE